MRVITLIAVALAALVTAAGASAAPRAGHKIDYSFLGQLTAVPANGQLPVTVQRGNRAALSAMLGQPVAQTFAYSGKTEFLKWSHGVPTVVKPGDLAAGDYVWIHIRDTAGASLADLEQKPAGLVGDHGSQLYPPKQPLYLFRGTLTATGRHQRHARRARRESQRDPPADRPARQRDLHGQRRHHLPPLAGESPDRDLARPAQGRRSDLRPHPRQEALQPCPGRSHSGRPRRRPRAVRAADDQVQVPRPADGDAGERPAAGHRAAWQPCRPARHARPARLADLRVRRQDRVPQVVARHPDRRQARRPRSRRLRLDQHP